MQKKRTITFSYQPQSHISNKQYYCSRVTDSLDYIPGEYYSKDEVQELCSNRNWKVTVVAPHME